MSRFGRPALVGSLGLAAAVVLGACAGNNPGSSGGAAGSSGSTGSTGSSAPAASGVVQVEAAKDGPYVFTPSAITVPAGPVTFSVHNAGSEEHEFEIFKGETVVDEVEGLVPGLTKALTVTLEPGEYTFMCKINGHDQLGMKGTLTVTGS